MSAANWHDDVLVQEAEDKTWIATAQRVGDEWRRRAWNVRYDVWLGQVVVTGAKRRPAHIERVIQQAVERLTR